MQIDHVWTLEQTNLSAPWLRRLYDPVHLGVDEQSWGWRSIHDRLFDLEAPRRPGCQLAERDDRER
jgi:hypothetical protein